MDHFYNLGCHRFLRWSLLLVFPFSLLAEWGNEAIGEALLYLRGIHEKTGHLNGNDATIINELQTANSHLGYIKSSTSDSRSSLISVGNTLADILDDTSLLSTMSSYLYNIQQYGYSIDAWEEANNDGIIDIAYACQEIADQVDKFKFANQSSNRNNVQHQSVFVHDVRSDDIYDALSALTNSLPGLFASVSNNINSLNTSILNLTNYLCTSPTYAESFTNYSGVLSYFGFRSQGLTLSTSSDSVFRSLFEDYFGYTPSQSELSDFKQQLTWYGSGLTWWQELLSEVPRYSAFANMSSYVNNKTLATIYDTAYDISYNSVGGGVMNPLRSQALMRDYVYGTRQLTDTTLGISNSVSEVIVTLNNISNSLFEVGSDYIVKSGSGSVSMGSTSSSILSGITESASFTGLVGTDIVEQAGAPIGQLSDASYQSVINDVTRSTPGDFTLLSDCLSSLSVFSGAGDDLVGALNGASSSQSLDSDSGSGFTIGGPISISGFAPVNASITIPRITQHTQPIVSVVCWFIRLGMCMFFFASAWNNTIKPCIEVGT